jgi:hypothetical protein
MWELGVMATYDAGKVTLQKSDLNFSGMRQSFGGGLVFYLADKLVFRAAVALGGGEGAHPFFGLTTSCDGTVKLSRGFLQIASAVAIACTFSAE